MNDKWVEYAIKIQSIAQAGLFYGKDKYDMERYNELRDISAQMIAEKTDIPKDKIYDLFCNESGYQTPKIDTRGAVFLDDKILLVHEDDGFWSMPGGWCDVDLSPRENIKKEVKEEAGIFVSVEKLISVLDWRNHNITNYPYGIIKFFFLCEYKGGEFKPNIETTEIGYFSMDNLPNNLSVHKNTKEQIYMCFKAKNNPNMQTIFE